MRDSNRTYGMLLAIQKMINRKKSTGLLWLTISVCIIAAFLHAKFIAEPTLELKQQKMSTRTPSPQVTASDQQKRPLFDNEAKWDGQDTRTHL